MISIPFARSFQVSETHDLITGWLSQKGWVAVSDDLGSQSTHTQIFNQQGRLICEGSGKGEHHLLGSLAEALEHYFGQQENRAMIKTIPSKELTTHHELSSCGITLNLISDYPEAQVLSVPMKPLNHHKNKSVWVPLILTNPLLCRELLPNHDESVTAHRYLSKYATNSGTALGQNKADALLHAILEIIERHYLSGLCQHLLGLKHPFEFYKLADEDLKEMISSKHHSDLQAYISSSFLGVHFALLFGGVCKDFPMGFMGAGASLDQSHALHRASSEYFQLKALKDDKLSADQRSNFYELNSYKSLRPLIDLSRSAALHNLPTAHEPAQKSIKNSKSVPQMLHEVVSKLHGWGYCVLEREKTPSSSPFSVVNVYIPGLDRFHLIRSAFMVSPQSVLKRST